MTIAATSRNSLLPLGQCLAPLGFAPILPRLANSPIRIMCDGTSITVGTSTTDQNAYRKDLYQLGVAAGLFFQFLGKFGSGTSPSDPWYRQMGVVGSTLPDHMSGGSVDTPLYLSGLAAGDRPQIIYHELVVNDASFTVNTTNYATNMVNYIAQLDAIGPFRHVWELAQQREQTAENSNINTINSAILSTIPTLVAGGTKIVAADSRVMQGVPGGGSTNLPGHFEKTGTGTWIHPDDTGDLFKSYACFVGMLLASGRQPSWAKDSNI